MDRATQTIQKKHDRFYKENGPCCAGCDYWQWYNSHIGDCTRTAPVSGKERYSMVMDVESCSLEPDAGHIMTPRHHVCGEFADTFDWSSLLHK